MDEKECKVCKKYTKAKYKYYKTWKCLAIIFICLTALFAILYFSSGDVFVEETTETNIRIEDKGENSKTHIITGDNSTISGTTESKDNCGIVIIVCVAILTGGVISGCYLISKKKENH